METARGYHSQNALLVACVIGNTSSDAKISAFKISTCGCINSTAAPACRWITLAGGKCCASAQSASDKQQTYPYRVKTAAQKRSSHCSHKALHNSMSDLNVRVRYPACEALNKKTSLTFDCPNVAQTRSCPEQSNLATSSDKVRRSGTPSKSSFGLITSCE